MFRPSAGIGAALLAFASWWSPGFAAAPADPGPAVESKASAPAAQEVIARFVREIGGKAALEKVQSQHMTGKFEMSAQGMNGTLEVFAKRPDKVLMKISLPGVGEMIQGFDGKVGWSLTPVTGPMLLEGKMLEQVREQANFDAVLHDASRFKSMQTAGQGQFDGKECYTLKLVKQSGQESTEYYDTKTGLLVGSSEVQETPLGSVPVTGVIGEYKKFGDILFATRLSEKMGPLTQVMTFQTMELNTVDDSVFELPEAIKALTKK
jgi:zinc protease